jgi:hypothetical protein
MSGKACSSSGMMSAMVAEAVMRVDQPWETMIGVETVAGSCPAHSRSCAYVSIACRLDLLKIKRCLRREIMPVLGFYGNEPHNSGSGTGSPTIIKLGLWEDQVR